MLRMSLKALHGDPDRVRHTRLPHSRIFTGVVRLPARAARSVASSAERPTNQTTLPPRGNRPEGVQIVNNGPNKRSGANPAVFTAGGLFESNLVLHDHIRPFDHLGADVVAELPGAERRHHRPH